MAHAHVPAFPQYESLNLNRFNLTQSNKQPKLRACQGVGLFHVQEIG